jgi:coiled-coil domain-containing protein 77
LGWQLFVNETLQASQKTALLFQRTGPTIIVKSVDARVRLAQKKFADERIAALMEDRRIRQEDFEASQAAANRKLDEMAASLKRAEERLQHTTHDLIRGMCFSPVVFKLDFGLPCK